MAAHRRTGALALWRRCAHALVTVAVLTAALVVSASPPPAAAAAGDPPACTEAQAKTPAPNCVLPDNFPEGVARPANPVLSPPTTTNGSEYTVDFTVMAPVIGPDCPQPEGVACTFPQFYGQALVYVPARTESITSPMQPARRRAVRRCTSDSSAPHLQRDQRDEVLSNRVS